MFGHLIRDRPLRRGDRAVLDRLRDERGRRVVLVSHCLLNENTRYAGGTTRRGAVDEVVEELMGAGSGIHQLPCPERLAWSDALKRHTLRLYGSKGGPLYPLRGPLVRAFVWWTRLAYWLARRVGRDVADYQRSGIAVVGIVGIAADSMGRLARRHSSMPSASRAALRPCSASRRTASWASTQYAPRQ